MSSVRGPAIAKTQITDQADQPAQRQPLPAHLAAQARQRWKAAYEHVRWLLNFKRLHAQMGSHLQIPNWSAMSEGCPGFALLTSQADQPAPRQPLPAHLAARARERWKGAYKQVRWLLQFRQRRSESRYLQVLEWTALREIYQGLRLLDAD